jgi:TRAP-type C4-dicarboxylate transport system substrate-binding protein
MKPVKFVAALAATGAALAWSASSPAETFRLRIATGHPPAVVYAGQMKDYFQAELQKRVEAKTKHQVQWVEGYGGSIVKVYETLGGVRDGIVDIGGFCFCFEPANLPMHAFQVMLPFGPVDSIDSLRVAQDVYAKVPYLTSVFEEKFNQKLLARITDASYNLGTNFEWKSLKELTGRRIAINMNTWKRLPKDVQAVMLETAKDFEEQVGKVNRARYERDINTLRGLIAVNSIDDAVRAEWARALKDWPPSMARDLDASGLPASQILKLTLEAAEKHGHRWPYRYEIK